MYTGTCESTKKKSERITKNKLRIFLRAYVRQGTLLSKREMWVSGSRPNCHPDLVPRGSHHVCTRNLIARLLLWTFVLRDCLLSSSAPHVAPSTKKKTPNAAPKDPPNACASRTDDMYDLFPLDLDISGQIDS